MAMTPSSLTAVACTRGLTRCAGRNVGREATGRDQRAAPWWILPGLGVGSGARAQLSGPAPTSPRRDLRVT